MQGTSQKNQRTKVECLAVHVFLMVQSQIYKLCFLTNENHDYSAVQTGGRATGWRSPKDEPI
jgi:hypothetical protein